MCIVEIIRRANGYKIDSTIGRFSSDFIDMPVKSFVFPKVTAIREEGVNNTHRITGIQSSNKIAAGFLNGSHMARSNISCCAYHRKSASIFRHDSCVTARPFRMIFRLPGEQKCRMSGRSSIPIYRWSSPPVKRRRLYIPKLRGLS
jgi:hypothetical protein